MAQEEIRLRDDTGRETKFHLIEDRWGSGAVPDHPFDHVRIGRPTDDNGERSTEMEAGNQGNEQVRCAALVAAPAARMKHHQGSANGHPVGVQIPSRICQGSARQVQGCAITANAGDLPDGFHKSVGLVETVVLYRMRGACDHAPDAQIFKGGPESVRIPAPTDGQIATAKKREKPVIDRVGSGEYIR